jgi:hypothetical protein
MSKLRSETCTAGNRDFYVPRDTALFLIRDSVERRGKLIHGRLNGPNGLHCAMGCFWADNPKASVDDTLIDEVATVNDSLGPNAAPKERWQTVRSWLRWKLRSMAMGAVTTK